MEQYAPKEFPDDPTFLSALDKLDDRLTKDTVKPIKYILPSQEQARKASVQLASSFEANLDDLSGTLSRGDIMSAIYDFARPSQQLQAYRMTASLVLLEHIRVAKYGLERRSITTLLSSLRGLIERTAFLTENQRRLQSKLGSDPLEMGKILESSEIIAKSITSTRIDLRKAFTNDIRKIKRSDIEYQQLEGSMDHGAKSILNSIDTLDKKVNGSRIVYEIYCEFLHPNIGDLIGSTINAEAFYSGTERIRFIRRELGSGATYLKNQVDISYIIDQSLKVVTDIIEQADSEFDGMKSLVERVMKTTTSSQHKILGLQRHLFSRGDLCPCLSGKTIRHCAPRAWRGK